MAPDADISPRTRLRELALLFLRLGSTAFGGPAAHIAMMQDEVVRRRKWLSEQEFLDLLGAANLIPGPNSTELAIHIGWQRARWSGLIVSGVSFILPAMMMTGALAWVYVRYGTVPSAVWLLYGVKPVIMSVVLHAIWGLAPRAARTLLLRVLALCAMGLAAVGVDELLVLFGTGALTSFVAFTSRSAQRGQDDERRPALLLLPAAAATPSAVGLTLPGLFAVFFKIGSVLFGSGYVLLAFLRADLVERLGWLTETQLIDAIAVGQITPGPVFTTATFIGYVLAGPPGALVATAGIFLPAFLFVAVTSPIVAKLRASRILGAFLDGVNVASLALMVVVTVQLGRTALIDAPTLMIGLVSALLLLRFKLNATWLIAAGAAAGWLCHALDLALT